LLSLALHDALPISTGRSVLDVQRNALSRRRCPHMPASVVRAPRVGLTAGGTGRTASPYTGKMRDVAHRTEEWSFARNSGRLIQGVPLRRLTTGAHPGQFSGGAAAGRGPTSSASRANGRRPVIRYAGPPAPASNSDPGTPTAAKAAPIRARPTSSVGPSGNTTPGGSTTPAAATNTPGAGPVR